MINVIGNNKKSIINNIFIFILFIILAIFSVFVIFHTHYLFGAGDMKFHMKRIIELEKSIKNGHILPMFSFNAFNGSSVMSLYPYLNLLPIILLSLFIKSNITLLYIFLASNVFLSLIVSYYSSFHFSKCKATSFVFSIAYSLSLPFLTYGFYDMDLGVITAISAFPLVIFGFFDLINDNTYLKLSIGLILISFSHVLSFIIAIVTLTLLLIINYKRLNKLLIKSLLKMIILVTLTSSIIWVPAFNVLLTNLGSIYPPAPASLSGTSFYVLFKNAVQGNITYGLSLISVLGLVLSIFFYKKLNSYTKQMLWISIGVLLICSKFFPWFITNYSLFKVFKIFQFTWRFYIIPEIFLSYIFAVIVTKYICNMFVRNIYIIISILIIISFQFMGQQKIIRLSIYSPTVTSSYINSNTYTQNVSVHHMLIPVKESHIKLLKQSYYKNPGYPYYKIHNDYQLDKFSNTNTNKDNCDYYPISSLSKINYINNNLCTYNGHVVSKLNNVKYNMFSFRSKRNYKQMTLPLLKYNNESLKLYLNHHRINFNQNKNSNIIIKNIHKGKNLLIVGYMPNVLIIILKSILFLLGVIWIIMCFIKYLKRNNVIG